MRKVIVIIAGSIAIWLGVRFIIGGSEDTWICDSGHWIPHGNPSSPPPTAPAGNSVIDRCDSINLWEPENG